MTEAEQIAFMAHAKHPLWCEFHVVLGCKAVFRSNNFDDWILHHCNHIGDPLPARLVCWFEDDKPNKPSVFPAEHTFEADITANGDLFENFRLRMMHIAVHHILQHKGTTSQRADWDILKAMRNRGLLTKEQWNRAMEWGCEGPRLPGEEDQFEQVRSESSERQELVKTSVTKEERRAKREQRSKETVFSTRFDNEARQ